MKYMTDTRHIPVLLQETVEALNIHPGDTVIDATLGGGGHTGEILKRVLPKGKVIALDADSDALKKFVECALVGSAIKQALADKSLILAHSNYSSLEETLKQSDIGLCDAIVADLGFSSDQISASERGFSFLRSGPLDMRFDRTTELTAEKIVNTFSAPELSKIFREYGDESESWRIALAIEDFRQIHPITTTGELSAIIERAYPKSRRRVMKIHPATKTFQALRIVVNRELEHLESFLKQAIECLKIGGRFAIITFHSGEDGLVKRFFKSQEKGCICPPEFPVCLCGRKPTIKILTKKPIISSEKEIKENPRARSARLRVIEKL
jgi:16S rRNA (cytosine1402-N4)-methyltransferase